MNLEGIIGWYQHRIGLYDKQSWETTVEQRILRGLSYSPRKTAKLKTDLIDVDLVRGSTFPKAKPQSDVWLAGLQGIVRLILLPFYYKWWIEETTLVGLILVVSMYCSVLTAIVIYATFSSTDELKNVPGFEVVLPAILLTLLSVILSQMACTGRKGLSVPFYTKKGSFLRNIKNGRRSRSGRGSSLILGPRANSSGLSSKKEPKRKVIRDKKFTNGIRPFNVCCRSLSEDLHSSQSIEIDHKSASENNLILQTDSTKAFGSSETNQKLPLKLQIISTEENIFPTDEKTISEKFYSKPLKNAYENYMLRDANEQEIHNPINELLSNGFISSECSVRYRGMSTCGGLVEKGKEGLQHISVTSPSQKKLTLSQDGSDQWLADQNMEKSSEGGSDDGEEGCNADCESPATDEEGNSCGDPKTKYKKLGNSFLLQKSDGSSSPFRRSHPKLPLVVVQQNVSNSSCESEGEEQSACSIPQFNNHKIMDVQTISFGSTAPLFIVYHIFRSDQQHMEKEKKIVLQVKTYPVAK